MQRRSSAVIRFHVGRSAIDVGGKLWRFGVVDTAAVQRCCHIAVLYNYMIVSINLNRYRCVPDARVGDSSGVGACSSSLPRVFITINAITPPINNNAATAMTAMAQIGNPLDDSSLLISP